LLLRPVRGARSPLRPEDRAPRGFRCVGYAPRADRRRVVRHGSGKRRAARVRDVRRAHLRLDERQGIRVKRRMDLIGRTRGSRPVALLLALGATTLLPTARAETFPEPNCIALFPVGPAHPMDGTCGADGGGTTD